MAFWNSNHTHINTTFSFHLHLKFAAEFYGVTKITNIPVRTQKNHNCIEQPFIYLFLQLAKVLCLFKHLCKIYTIYQMVINNISGYQSSTVGQQTIKYCTYAHKLIIWHFPKNKCTTMMPPESRDWLSNYAHQRLLAVKSHAPVDRRRSLCNRCCPKGSVGLSCSYRTHTVTNLRKIKQTCIS